MEEVKREGGSTLSGDARRLWEIAKSVIEHPPRIRKLELLDHLAVALILDRREFLPDGEFTIVQAVNFLGPQRMKVAIAVERALMFDSFEDDEAG